MKALSRAARVAAIRRTAAHIARYPHLYNFYRFDQDSKQLCPLARCARLHKWKVPSGGYLSLDLTAKRLGFVIGAGWDERLGFYGALESCGCNLGVGSHEQSGNAPTVAKALRVMADRIERKELA